MIKSEGISKFYGKKCVFSDLTADFVCKTYGLLGPNGAGKTTFLRILTGLLSPTKGAVKYVDGSGAEASMDKCRIGYLPQKFGAFKEITLREQMEYFAALKKIPFKLQKEEIDKALRAVNLEQEADKKCGKLSGGMVRRLGIAQAILGQPDLLLLDEPTTGLDPEERMRFKSIIMNLQHQFPMILSTHIVEDVEAVCEDILVMNGGGLLFQGSARELSRKAAGHVFTLREADQTKLKVPHYVEKYSEGEEGKRLQILTFEHPDEEEMRCLSAGYAGIDICIW